MKATARGRARSARLAILGAALALVAAACIPPPEEPTPTTLPDGPDRINFSSPLELGLSIDRGTPEEPNVATLPFTGTANGAWLLGDNGLFYANLDIEDGALEISEEASPIGAALTVGLTAEQTGTAVGFFDPATGAGSFTTGIDITIASLDAGDGPAPMPQPCVANTSYNFTGEIDGETGVLSVHADDFALTPPGAADCGGLGALIGPMLVGTTFADLSFEVGTP